ncbi:MAG: SMP-30/gluconolactonase/LRE family protein [Bacteroidales bacterium]|nr:SMP-30/gluconolactonase/LRE family protein [Bacteroidales bacterium]
MRKLVSTFVCTSLITTFCIASNPLIKEGAELVLLADTFRFTEGPAADEHGNVFFSDIPAWKIYKWNIDGSLELYRSGERSTNGLMFDADGNLIMLDTKKGRSVVKHDMVTGDETILVQDFNGKRYNSPNDLWIDSKGGIYFTDPRYGNRDNMELESESVYYLKPGGNAIEVEDKMIKPNGIIGTPDNKTLYIADHKGGKVYKYHINKDGSLSKKTEFAEGKCDGMTMDENGNVYLTTTHVEIYSPGGSKIQTIEMPRRPTNATFGGKNQSTLFITTPKAVYTIEMNIKGVK